MSTRSLDIPKLIAMSREFDREYAETGFLALGPRAHHVQIAIDAMTEVAPLEKWKLNTPRQCKTYPYAHTCIVDGVTFEAISTQPVETPAGNERICEDAQSMVLPY